MLALSLPAAMREAKHGFAHPKREHGSRTPKPRTVHPTADRSQSGNNDLSATERKCCVLTTISFSTRVSTPPQGPKGILCPYYEHLIKAPLSMSMVSPNAMPDPKRDSATACHNAFWLPWEA